MSTLLACRDAGEGPHLPFQRTLLSASSHNVKAAAERRTRRLLLSLSSCLMDDWCHEMEDPWGYE